MGEKTEKHSALMESFLQLETNEVWGADVAQIDRYESVKWWDIQEKNMVAIVVDSADDLLHAVATLYSYISETVWSAYNRHEEEASQKWAEIQNDPEQFQYIQDNHIKKEDWVYTDFDGYRSFGLSPALIIPEALKPITEMLPDDFAVYIVVKTPKQSLLEELGKLKTTQGK